MSNSIKTYRDLRDRLCALNEEQLDQDITTYREDIDEYYPAKISVTTPDTDVLDPGHVVLTIKNDEPVALDGFCED